MTAPPFAPSDSIDAARRKLIALFTEAGLPMPDLDASLLTGHVLRLDRAALLVASDRPLGGDAEHLAEAARRRLQREPVARILGEWEFWSLPLRLGAAALVPRPETETLVEAALAETGGREGRNRPLHILDLGTGSGALLIALLHERPQAFGIGVDRSAEAAALARANAAMNGLGGRAAFLVGDWAEALAAPFDLVVCNPPYIATPDLPGLEPEVRDHDPRLALDGGPDGLAAYRTVTAALPELLRPDGVAVLEVGAGQDSAVAEMLARAGMDRVTTRCDLAGRPRAVLGRQPAATT